MHENHTHTSGSQVGAILSPRGHVAMSGDVSGCHSLGGGVLLASND